MDGFCQTDAYPVYSNHLGKARVYGHVCIITIHAGYKRNWLRTTYCLLSACFFPGFAAG